MFEWKRFSGHLQEAVAHRDDHPACWRGRARTARMLGLYEQALKHYARALQLTEGQPAHGALQEEAARCAGDAARDAVARGDWGRAASWFEAMAALARGRASEEARASAALVRTLERSPREVSVRLAFVSQFYLQPESGRRRRGALEAARAMLAETLRMKPTDAQRRSLYGQLHAVCLALGDLPSAAAWAEKRGREFPTASDEG